MLLGQPGSLFKRNSKGHLVNDTQGCALASTHVLTYEREEERGEADGGIRGLIQRLVRYTQTDA